MLVAPKQVQHVVRNPLGIIALFLFLIYGLATLALSVSGLQPDERLPLVWFLVIFPLIVLVMFGWLVSRHHQKLYAPSDYRDDDGFLRSAEFRTEQVRGLQKQYEQLKLSIDEILRSKLGAASGQIGDAIAEVSTALDAATSIEVSLAAVPDAESVLLSYPVAAFGTFGELTDSIYFDIDKVVSPFEYGHSWVLRDRATGHIIKNARMITGAPPGEPVPDNRQLAEVGIRPGSRLAVELISGGKAPKSRRR